MILASMNTIVKLPIHTKHVTQHLHTMTSSITMNTSGGMITAGLDSTKFNLLMHGSIEMVLCISSATITTDAFPKGITKSGAMVY